MTEGDAFRRAWVRQLRRLHLDVRVSASRARSARDPDGVLSPFRDVELVPRGRRGPVWATARLRVHDDRELQAGSLTPLWADVAQWEDAAAALAASRPELALADVTSRVFTGDVLWLDDEPERHGRLTPGTPGFADGSHREPPAPAEDGRQTVVFGAGARLSQEPSLVEWIGRRPLGPVTRSTRATRPRSRDERLPNEALGLLGGWGVRVALREMASVVQVQFLERIDGSTLHDPPPNRSEPESLRQWVRRAWSPDEAVPETGLALPSDLSDPSPARWLPALANLASAAPWQRVHVRWEDGFWVWRSMPRWRHQPVRAHTFSESAALSSSPRLLARLLGDPGSWDREAFRALDDWPGLLCGYPRSASCDEEWRVQLPPAVVRQMELASSGAAPFPGPFLVQPSGDVAPSEDAWMCGLPLKVEMTRSATGWWVQPVASRLRG